MLNFRHLYGSLSHKSIFSSFRGCVATRPNPETLKVIERDSEPEKYDAFEALEDQPKIQSGWGKGRLTVTGSVRLGMGKNKLPIRKTMFFIDTDSILGMDPLAL